MHQFIFYKKNEAKILKKDKKTPLPPQKKIQSLTRVSPPFLPNSSCSLVYNCQNREYDDNDRKSEQKKSKKQKKRKRTKSKRAGQNFSKTKKNSKRRKTSTLCIIELFLWQRSLPSELENATKSVQMQNKYLPISKMTQSYLLVSMSSAIIMTRS